MELVRTLLIVLSIVLLLLPSVVAVGIVVSPDLGSRQMFYVNESESHVFVVRGDAEEHRIEFYVRPADDAVVVSGFENGEYAGEWRKTVDVGVYEDVEFKVWFKGLVERDEYFDVTYGFKYLDDVGDGDMGFQQATEAVFEARVTCYTCGTSSGSSSQYVPGKSGGGGGAVVFGSENVTENKTVKGVVPSVSPVVDDAVVKDVAGESSGVDKLVVPRKVSVGESSSVGATGVVKSGRGVALMFLVMLCVMMGLTMATMSAVKGDNGG